MAQTTMLFSKSLTDTDINKRLAIPTKILPSLPDFNIGSHNVKIHLLYRTKMWPIVCSIRRRGGYKKPVFSGGWRNFVICNNFNVGDKLTLYKIQDGAEYFHYNVEVEKPARRPSGDLSGPPPARSLNHDDHEVDHVIAKPSGAWMFGNNVSDEVTSKANLKTTELQKGVCMGEPRSRKEETVIKLFGLAEEAANATVYAYGTSQAAAEAYYKSTTTTINLDLTLAPPIMDMEDSIFLTIRV